MSSPTTSSMTAGSTRLPASSRAISAMVRSRRLSARQARSRACCARISGSRRRAPAVSRAPSESGRTICPRSDRGDLGDCRPLLVLDRLDQVLVAEPERLVDLGFDLLGHLDMLVEVGLGVVAALAEPLVAVGEERAGLG